MSTAASLDVSRLPASAFDSRAPVWWGNTLMMLIESTTVAILFVAYFYLWQMNAMWPPPQVNSEHPILRPLPELPFATVNAVLLLASCLPMLLADRRSRRQQAGIVQLCNGLVLLAGVAAAVLRYFEFEGVHFRWDDNAYATIVWSILFLHFTYILVGIGEIALLIIWIGWYGLEEKLAVDVTLTAAYWYWMAAVGVLSYAIVYWAPRLA